jgi:hypothetical protein
MQQQAGAPTQQPSPRVLIYISALTCGLFLALAVHIGLTSAGMGLTSTSAETFLVGKDQIHTALAWWATGIAGCAGSLAAIFLARNVSRPLARLLRLILAAGFFCLLAIAGHKAAAPPAGGAALTVAGNLAAMTLGGFMAFFAAHFAARR